MKLCALNKQRYALATLSRIGGISRSEFSANTFLCVSTHIRHSTNARKPQPGKGKPGKRRREA